MKKTVNKQGNPGMLKYNGRPDRTKAPLIKQPVRPSEPVKPIRGRAQSIAVLDDASFMDKRQGKSEKEFDSRPIDSPKINPSGNFEEAIASNYTKKRRS